MHDQSIIILRAAATLPSNPSTDTVDLRSNLALCAGKWKDTNHVLEQTPSGRHYTFGQTLRVPWFPDLSNGYYVGLHGAFGGKKLSSWYSLTLPITGIGEQGATRVNEEEASSGFMGRYGSGDSLGYVIGAKAVLDAPGEWYSDGNEVLLIPPIDAPGAYEFRTRLYGAVISGHSVLLENNRFKAATARVNGDDVSFKINEDQRHSRFG